MRVAILISGRGSNMERLIESCKINNKSASIELVFSNNAKASGLSFAKNYSIKTSIIDHRVFEKREDFDHELDKKLRDLGEEPALIGKITNNENPKTLVIYK